MATLDLRPLSLGELLDRTFFLYRRNFLLLCGIAAIPYAIAIVVVMLFAVLARLAGTAGPTPANHLPISGLDMGAIGGGIFALVLIFFALFLTSFGATVLAVSEIYVGRPVRIRNAMNLALRRFFSLLGVAVLSFLIVAAGMILLVIPGIYLACRLSVALTTTVIDRIGPGESIQRSFSLTKGFAWRAFMIVLLAVAISWAVVAVFQVPFFILIAVSAKHPALVMLWGIVSNITSIAGSIIVAPVATIGFVLFYYDLRVRKEAFDLQMMMQAIGVEPPPPPVTGGVPSMFGRDAS